MDKQQERVPVVMSFSAHDPSGLSGVQADIETLGALRCHCSPIVTALTTQDTSTVASNSPCPANLLVEQSRMILADIPVAVFKIGMLGSEENAAAVHTVLQDYPHIPVILDATLITYDIEHYEHLGLSEALRQLIIPASHILVVNAKGAQHLAGHSDTLEASAHQLMAYGAEHVLLTGASYQEGCRTNSFFGNFRLLESFSWRCPSQEFQGEGSTLSAAIAARRAHGLSALAAVHEGQAYTHRCLDSGFRLGMGRHVPNRLYQIRESVCAYDAINTDTNK